MASINKGFIPVSLTGGLAKGGTTLGKIYKGYDLIYDTVPGVGPYVPTNAEVVAWAAATGITTDALIEAVDDFVSGCKTDGIWSKFDVVYPFVTDSTDTATIKDQFKYNLVDTNSYGLSYTGSSTVGYGGYTNGGTGAMVGTGYNPSTDLGSTSDVHYALYTNSGNPGTDVIDLGGGGGSTFSYLICGRTTPANSNQCEVVIVQGQSCGTTGNSIFTGLFVGTYANPTIESYNTRLWRRGSIVQNDTGTSGNIANTMLGIGCFYYGNSIINPTSKTYQFFSAGDHLDSTDVANFTTRVDNLQTAVDAIYATSRAVA